MAAAAASPAAPPPALSAPALDAARSPDRKPPCAFAPAATASAHKQRNRRMARHCTQARHRGGLGRSERRDSE
jgi:hypothetical protein